MMSKRGNCYDHEPKNTYTTYVFTPGTVDYTVALPGAESQTLNGVQGHLLTVESAPENATIDKWVYDLSYYNWNGGPVIWLGMSDEQQEGVWRYTSGPNKGQVATYTNWFPGEPNLGTAENYATLNTAAQTSDGTVYSGTWFDADINYTFNVIGYVTEFNGIKKKPSISTLPDNSLTVSKDGDLILVGDANANRLTGGNADDELYGRHGDDLLIAGGGADLLSGGQGADTFQFNQSAVAPGKNNADTITDFTSGTDKIDLSQIDANVLSAADDAFDFIGDAKFTGAAGELRMWKGVLSGDTDGDKHADFQIQLSKTATLLSSDFIL